MTDRRPNAVERLLPPPQPSRSIRPHSRDIAQPYRFDIIAANVLDAVSLVGGSAFDMATAGWKVRILLADPGDDRPLRILGATPIALDAALKPGSSFPELITVAVDLLVSDARTRQYVLAALKNGDTEVTIWGQAWPEKLEPVGLVEHHPTIAARAFKTQALTAAGALDGRERFLDQPGAMPQMVTWLGTSAPTSLPNEHDAPSGRRRSVRHSSFKPRSAKRRDI
jgi:hypothetical protein